jgi:hypothetical protein
MHEIAKTKNQNERLNHLYNQIQATPQASDHAQRVQDQIDLFSIVATGSLTSPSPKPRVLSQSLPVYRIKLVEVEHVKLPSVQLRSSFDAASLLQNYLCDTDREHFVVLLLNRKNRFIGINTVSIDSLAGVVVGCLKTPFLGQIRCPAFGPSKYRS